MRSQMTTSRRFLVAGCLAWGAGCLAWGLASVSPANAMETSRGGKTLTPGVKTFVQNIKTVRLKAKRINANVLDHKANRLRKGNDAARPAEMLDNLTGGGPLQIKDPRLLLLLGMGNRNSVGVDLKTDSTKRRNGAGILSASGSFHAEGNDPALTRILKGLSWHYSESGNLRIKVKNSSKKSGAMALGLAEGLTEAHFQSFDHYWHTGEPTHVAPFEIKRITFNENTRAPSDTEIEDLVQIGVQTRIGEPIDVDQPRHAETGIRRIFGERSLRSVVLEPPSGAATEARSTAEQFLHESTSKYFRLEPSELGRETQDLLVDGRYGLRDPVVLRLETAVGDDPQQGGFTLQSSHKESHSLRQAALHLRWEVDKGKLHIDSGVPSDEKATAEAQALAAGVAMQLMKNNGYKLHQQILENSLGEYSTQW